MKELFLLNLYEIVGNTELESLASKLIEGFSCPRNVEIESFLKNKALDFARRKCSISYLVLDEEKRLLGYFTLTHKNLYVNAVKLSQTRKRRLRAFAGPDDGAGLFNVSAFLIAQLGRNFAIPPEEGIKGDELLRMALTKLQEAQAIVGGGVVFLECEDEEKLLSFYQREPNCFIPIGERTALSDGTKYWQLLRFL